MEHTDSWQKEKEQEASCIISCAPTRGQQTLANAAWLASFGFVFLKRV
jgi:hypothetical protein